MRPFDMIMEKQLLVATAESAACPTVALARELEVIYDFTNVYDALMDEEFEIEAKRVWAPLPPRKLVGVEFAFGPETAVGCAIYSENTTSKIALFTTIFSAPDMKAIGPVGHMKFDYLPSGKLESIHIRQPIEPLLIEKLFFTLIRLAVPVVVAGFSIMNTKGVTTSLHDFGSHIHPDLRGKWRQRRGLNMGLRRSIDMSSYRRVAGSRIDESIMNESVERDPFWAATELGIKDSAWFTPGVM